MNTGTLYGIGIGPGDPELMTVKGMRLLASSKHIFVPKSKDSTSSIALKIAGQYLSADARIFELIFPMTKDRAELERKWSESAATVAGILQKGEDACFLTLGDPFLFSTYIYLLRALKKVMPDVNIVTIPGVTSINAAAALASFALGEGKDTVTIIPGSELDRLQDAINCGGSVVLMKVGRHLPAVLDILEEADAIDRAVLVSRVGLDGQRIEIDLRALRDKRDSQVGYMSLILIHGKELRT